MQTVLTATNVKEYLQEGYDGIGFNFMDIAYECEQFPEQPLARALVVMADEQQNIIENDGVWLPAIHREILDLYDDWKLAES